MFGVGPFFSLFIGQFDQIEDCIKRQDIVF